ncbi:MAG: type I-E CRISPR-associated protein Cse1/CasA [Deltaproteobacteria bacterium]|nr:type I-E CRISPR-associated protein Cse1/CasA [Deltaproteobacteria bacterium]
MNLINDQWIPVRHADGSVDKIAPWEVTKDINDEKKMIVAVASPRPDFDGALTQFLIGLLQTACTPETEDDWWVWQEKQPIPEQLQSLFNPFAASFELEGEGPRFMQDFQPDELSEISGIAALLIETPGENALKKGTDHFVKRDKVKQLCSHCAAAAIYTLQLNAPAGGAGNRTGLRGGGPLTTLILGKSLWETCWINVLIKSNYFSNSINTCENESPLRFPWREKTRISNKGTGQDTYFGDMHPDQLFWAMPRRIFLIDEDSTMTEACDLCGNKTDKMYRKYKNKNYGVHYMGAYEHPLSPHYIKNNAPSPIHPQPGGVIYSHWLGLVENSSEGDNKRRPAKVVNQFRSLTLVDAQLWAFGFDMDKAKARCWYSAKMPVLHIEDSFSSIFSSHSTNMIKTSRYVSGLLVAAVLKGQMAEPRPSRNDAGYLEIDWKWPKDLLGRLRKSPTEKTKVIEKKINAFVEELDSRVQKSMMCLLDSARLNFWSITEDDFYDHLKKIRDAIINRNNEHHILESWVSILKEEAIKIFDRHVNSDDFNAVDPKRIAIARNELVRSLNSDRLRNIIGLPKNINK